MLRSRPKTFLFGLYIPILLASLMLPRQASIDSVPMGHIEWLLHEILFLSGPPEIVLNFLLFIPFFFALVVLVPALSHYWAALISVLTSFAAELAQSQITGRVSSVRDFFSNSIGVMIAYAFFIALSNRKKYSKP